MKRPETPAEFSVYRCKASCKIGRDALERKIQIPENITAMEYAFFNLLHAVEELADLLEKKL